MPPRATSRRRGRELALQVLYSADLNPSGLAEALGEAQERAGDDADARAFARELVEGAVHRREEADRLITNAALRWDIGRMAVVDRNLLRLAAYELAWVPATPSRVVINEAIELAKSFGGEESANFVNGILDRIRTDLGRVD